MGITLYPHQNEQINAVREAMRSNKSVLMQSPTGSGKSVMAAAMISAAREKKRRALFIVPRRELLRQMSNTFSEFQIPHSYIAAGLPFNPMALTHIASLGSLVKKMHLIKPDVVFVDETHFGQGTLDKAINYYKSVNAWIIGLSATPVKLSGQGLDCWYDTMVLGKSPRWLIDNGFLSDYRAFAPSHPDLSGIKTVLGDYAIGELSDRMENDKVLIGNAVKHYKDHALGKLNLAYCVSIKHSQIVCEQFNEQGIRALHIDGKIDDDERKKIIKAFAKREVTVLCSCDLLTFGFDLSSSAGMDVTVESMSDLRPTQSIALTCQKWGRVLRKKPFPALIFDHANNIEKHGLPCEEREWALEGKQKRKGPQDRVLAIKQCPGCFFCHKPALACPNCKYVYPVESREIGYTDDTLSEIDPNKVTRTAADKRRAKRAMGMAKTVADLQAIADEHGFKKGWVWHTARAKGIMA